MDEPIVSVLTCRVMLIIADDSRFRLLQQPPTTETVISGTFRSHAPIAPSRSGGPWTTPGIITPRATPRSPTEWNVTANSSSPAPTACPDQASVGPPEFVLEQAMRLQLAERPRALPTTVAKYPGRRQPGFVAKDALADTSQEGERGHVAVQQHLGGLRRIGLHEATVTGAGPRRSSAPSPPRWR